MSYRNDILDCVQVLGRCRLAIIQQWFVDKGQRPPADITIKSHLAVLVREGQIERPGMGLYCAPGKSPEAPKITPWAAGILKQKQPDFLTPGQLRALYAKSYGLKLSLELFEKAIDELMREEKLISYHGRAFAWDHSRSSPTKGS